MKRSLVIAWQGLPFYARRCVRHFVEHRPEYAVVAVTSRLDVTLAVAEKETGCRVMETDSEKAVGFAQLGLEGPEHLLVTSWSHAAWRALARETRAAGGAVTTLVDNNYRGTLKQRLGAVWFRVRLRGMFDDAWTPGAKGHELLRVFGMPDERIHEGLYCADETVFYPPATGADESERSGVLFVGQLIERKAVRDLWRAWPTAPKLSIIGEGPLRAELIAEGAPVEGALAPGELAARMRGATALVLPSLVDHWGMVLHEAARCGCVLLATEACGAAHDLVRHRINGYLMAHSGAREVAAALAWLRALTPAELAVARAASVERAARFSRARWSETLVGILRRQAEDQNTRGRFR